MNRIETGRVHQWAVSDDTGASSKTIWCALLGVPVTVPSVPRSDIREFMNEHAAPVVVGAIWPQAAATSASILVHQGLLTAICSPKSVGRHLANETMIGGFDVLFVEDGGSSNAKGVFRILDHLMELKKVPKRRRYSKPAVNDE